MKALTASAVALSALGFASVAQAQQAGKLFFEGDIVRGASPARPVRSACSTTSSSGWKRWCGACASSIRRARRSTTRGSRASSSQLPDGQKLDARFGPHPPPQLGTGHGLFLDGGLDHSGRAIRAARSPTRSSATDLDGKTHTWEPFKIESRRSFTVVAGAIEIKKPKSSRRTIRHDVPPRLRAIDRACLCAAARADARARRGRMAAPRAAELGPEVAHGGAVGRLCRAARASRPRTARPARRSP